MKKLLAFTGLMALAATANADRPARIGDFHNGFHLGGSVGYTYSQSKQEVKTATPEGFTFKGWAPLVTLDAKYSVNCGTMYQAADARIGWVFGKDKNGSARMKEGFTAGVGYRLGTFFGEKTAVFARLGLNANQQKFTYEFNGTRKTDTYMDYGFEPGVGAEWVVSEGIGIELLYGYNMSFATRGYNDREHKFSKAPATHHIALGVSVHI
jgi:hypothetical protein